MVDQTPYYVAFSHMLGIGPIRFANLLHRFQTPKDAYLAPIKEIQNVVGSAIGVKFEKFRQNFDPQKTLETIKKKDISVIVPLMQEYPSILRTIADPPICIYIKGNSNLLSKDYKSRFAIVGTRRVTDYGRHLATLFATGLSDAGFTIVSGMAIGIDAIAHWSTIQSGGATIAVLGCGVDIIYPRENTSLYRKILVDEGAIISEFPPGMTVIPGLFIARNRIVSGISRGVLVVEGASRSGTLITAKYAAEQGRDVFAPPSPITSSSSAAPNILLKQGAKLVTSVQDILDEYDLRVQSSSEKEYIKNLSQELHPMVELLAQEPHTPDDLSLKLKRDVSSILTHLTTLEIAGAIAKNSEGKYYVK